MSKKKLNLSVTVGYRTALLDGCLVPDSPYHMATEFFYPVSKGDYIECINREYVFAVATFAEEREDKYLYTYDYKTDSAWLIYRQDLTPDSYSRDTYIFEEDGYCRICLKRADGMEITQKDADKINQILAFYAEVKTYQPKECFRPEIMNTVQKVKALWNNVDENMGHGDGVNGHEHADACKGLLSFVLLTDSHYTVNGTWEDTADNIKKVLMHLEEDDGDWQFGEQTQAPYCDCKSMDGIVHLGDFTDGMTSKMVTSFYVERMMNDLCQNGLPVYVTLGNHDSNYFRGNKQRFTMTEQRELFGLTREYYYHDFADQKLRCLFLSSYDADTPVRYGFSDDEVEWVKKTLDMTPKGYKVLVFSHEAPLDILDYWARIIRNGKKLIQVLEEYNAKEDCQILAYIHGHTHAEHVYRGSSFPIISIGCNKCEYFPDKKPEGSHAYERKPDTVTQDLWDVLMVDVEGERLHFVRFGAGEDRVVDCKKTESIWRNSYAEKKKARATKIWAHRGSSGFAPENTIPSFEIAKELDVDGIELDVQMTKDGELVVIHDETINRTSDGKGYVKDYTLEELRSFNFAKNKPAFGFAAIPTLREVYELFRDTDYVINVELKTGIIAYDGSDVLVGSTVGTDGGKMPVDKRCMEEKVHELTVEMGMEERVIYSSFNHVSILKMQQYITKEQTAFLFSDGWLGPASYGAAHNVQAMHPTLYYPEMENMVRKCHEKGMRVHVWTVNEEEHALRLRRMGVDAIITNHPGKMRELYYNNKE